MFWRCEYSNCYGLVSTEPTGRSVRGVKYVCLSCSQGPWAWRVAVCPPRVLPWLVWPVLLCGHWPRVLENVKTKIARKKCECVKLDGFMNYEQNLFQTNLWLLSSFVRLTLLCKNVQSYMYVDIATLSLFWCGPLRKTNTTTCWSLKVFNVCCAHFNGGCILDLPCTYIVC